MIIVSALIAYYIANVYNVATNKYKLKDMTTVIVINGILMTVTTFSKIFTFYEGIILFGIITIFQIAFRYIVIMAVVEKERVVFVGENDYTEDLLESVKRGDISGMSFGFIATVDEWNEESTPTQRTVKKAELFEITVTSIPAYPDSSLELAKRSRMAAQKPKLKSLRSKWLELLEVA